MTSLGNKVVVIGGAALDRSYGDVHILDVCKLANKVSLTGLLNCFMHLNDSNLYSPYIKAIFI